MCHLEAERFCSKHVKKQSGKSLSNYQPRMRSSVALRDASSGRKFCHALKASHPAQAAGHSTWEKWSTHVCKIKCCRWVHKTHPSTHQGWQMDGGSPEAPGTAPHTLTGCLLHPTSSHTYMCFKQPALTKNSQIGAHQFPAPCPRRYWATSPSHSKRRSGS